MLSPENLVGASLPDIAVFFSPSGQLLQGADVVLDGPKKAVLMCDLRPGLWSLTRGDGEVSRVRVNAQSEAIFLDDLEGSVHLAYLRP